MDNSRASTRLFIDKSLERKNVDCFAYGALRYSELLGPLSLDNPDASGQRAVHDFGS
jgi:hypothetical protein